MGAPVDRVHELDGRPGRDGGSLLCTCTWCREVVRASSWGRGSVLGQKRHVTWRVRWKGEPVVAELVASDIKKSIPPS